MFNQGFGGGFIATPSMGDIEHLRRQVAVLTWLLAELQWKHQYHGHDGGGDWGTSYGARLPHWL